MSIQTSDNKFGTAQWIVDPTLGLGTQQTITAALAAASSGDTIFIRPGTYTEDLTLKAGVNLAAYDGDQSVPTVTIVGNATATFAGTCAISDIRLQTNSAPLLTVSGSSATVVYLNRCFLNMTNNTGINFSSSSSSATINVEYTRVDLGTTGIGVYTMSSPGTLAFRYAQIFNSGGSSTTSTNSAGLVGGVNCGFLCRFETSGTGGLSFSFSGISVGSFNLPAVVANGSGTHSFIQVSFNSGTASGITIGASAAVTVHACSLDSTNTSIISGTGSLDYSGLSNGTNAGDLDPSNLMLQSGGFYTEGISFDGGNNFLNFYEEGSFTPVLAFGGASVGITYSEQEGAYTRIGNIVFGFISMVLTSKGTSIGSATISGLPYTIGDSNSCAINRYSNLTYLATRDTTFGTLIAAGTSISLSQSGDNVGTSPLTNTQFANDTILQFTFQYIV